MNDPAPILDDLAVGARDGSLLRPYSAQWPLPHPDDDQDAEAVQPLAAAH